VKISLLVVTLVLTLFFANISPVSAAEKTLETQVTWRPQCSGEIKSRELILTILSVIAPKLTSSAIDAAATALVKAGERTELARSSAKTLSQPYALHSNGDLGIAPELGCLVVMRGKSDPDQPGVMFDQTKPETLLMFFEAKLNAVPGEPYFQLVPYRLHVGEFEESSIWSPGERDYTVAISFFTPGIDKPFASTIFTFAGVQKHSDANAGSPLLSGKTSGYLSLPQVPDSWKKIQEKQEAAIAPYVLAASILAAKEKSEFATPDPSPAPAPTESPETSAALATVCKAIEAYNDTHPASPIGDGKCGDNAALSGMTASKDARLNNGKPEAQAPPVDQMLAWAMKTCPSPSKDTQGNLSCDGAKQLQIAPDARFGHIVTNTTLVEARPGNKFSALLGDVLSMTKSDISKVVEQKISAVQTEKSKATADMISSVTSHEVTLADLGVTYAEQTLSKLQTSGLDLRESNEVIARAALIRAKIAANDAYRTANLRAPYPELERSKIFGD
jgi:hypothetical protein